MKAFWIIALLSLVSLGSVGVYAWHQPLPREWALLLQQIRQRFPNAPQISTAQVAAWLEASKKDPQKTPIFVDVRAPHEYAVSHFPGALHLPDVSSASASDLASQKRTIVVYCSVGYRSSEWVERWLSRHPRSTAPIYNLEGSLFQWANEGRPTYRSSRPTPSPYVHPFDRFWGRHLQRRYHRWKP